MRPYYICILMVVACVALADPCQQYYGKGYCTDYVNSKLRIRVRGDAESWPANTPVEKIQAGDVAIFRREGHVAWVEHVEVRSGRVIAVTVSEQNYGREWVNRECRVTNNFGKTTTRRIEPSKIDGVYREIAPFLGREKTPGPNANSTPSQVDRSRKKK